MMISLNSDIFEGVPEMKILADGSDSDGVTVTPMTTSGEQDNDSIVKSCVICSRKFAPAVTELKNFKSENHQDGIEKSLLRLFNIPLEKFSGNSKISNPVTHIDYCLDCSLKIHRVSELYSDIQDLMNQVEVMKTVIENEFRSNFVGDDWTSPELYRDRQEFMRFEIARSLNLVVEGVPAQSTIDEVVKQTFKLKKLQVQLQILPSTLFNRLPVQVSDVPGYKADRPVRAAKIRSRKVVRRIIGDMTGNKIKRAKKENKDLHNIEFETADEDYHPIDEMVDTTVSTESESSNCRVSPNDQKGAVGSERVKSRSRTKQEAPKKKPRYFCEVPNCANKKGFLQTELLQLHIKKVHEGITHPFKCEECDASFRKANCLKHHYTSKHLGLYQHVCEFCNKGFTYKTDLQRHLPFHTNEKNYQCTLCPEAFKTMHGRRYHIRYIHTGERPYSCDRCGKGFVNGTKLNNHIKSVHNPEHRPVICHLCGKGFPIPDYLYMHMKSHKDKATTKSKPKNKKDLSAACTVGKSEVIDQNQLGSETSSYNFSQQAVTVPVCTTNSAVGNDSKSIVYEIAPISTRTDLSTSENTEITSRCDTASVELYTASVKVNPILAQLPKGKDEEETVVGEPVQAASDANTCNSPPPTVHLQLHDQYVTIISSYSDINNEGM